MKTAPFDLEKALAGHPLVTESGLPATRFVRNKSHQDYCYAAKIADCIRSFTASGIHDLTSPNNGYSLLLALPDDPPLSPEEQAVISALRAGRKVTVEELPKMPRRCWAQYYEGTLDLWRSAYRIQAHISSGVEAVQLIELTPEVSAALVAAGIRWEDAPTGNPLPECLSPLPKGVPPLPEGAVYLGMGKTFKNPKRGFPGFASFGGGDPWEWQDEWVANSGDLHYAAPANSEIARLNSKP
jgi:hypothetical protein